MSALSLPPGLIMPPYALALGMEIDHLHDGVPVIAYDFSDNVTGRPGFLHGGALSGLMEIAAIIALQVALAADAPHLRLKPVNISVDFMRGGRPMRTFALGKVTRQGRRTANVEAHAWQQDRAKPIASARMNFVLSPLEK